MTMKQLRQALETCRFDDHDVVIDVPGDRRYLNIKNVVETSLRVYIETEAL